MIASEWIFQLNGDATFSFCHTAVDMIGLGVSSLGNHNHPVCWSIIPHHTEGELTYTGTFIELQDAFLLAKDLHTCSNIECHFCECHFPKTLSTIFLLMERQSQDKLQNLAKAFAERVREIEATEGTALHLKIETWHMNNAIEEIDVGFPKLEDLQSLLMPRQHVLKRIDPTISKSVDEVRRELKDLKKQYVEVVIIGKQPKDLGVSDALDLYETFHHLENKKDWVMLPIPLSCSCATNHKDCCCKHAGLVTSVFDPKIKVPTTYIAAEPSLRKLCKKSKGHGRVQPRPPPGRASEGQEEEYFQASVLGNGVERWCCSCGGKRSAPVAAPTDRPPVAAPTCVHPRDLRPPPRGHHHT